MGEALWSERLQIGDGVPKIIGEWQKSGGNYSPSAIQSASDLLYDKV